MTDADSGRAEAFFFDGCRRLEAADAAGAERCFRQALALAPAMGEALLNLALLREKAGAVAEAEACYRQALDRLPDCARIYLNLGVLLMNRKRFAEAEAVCRQALALAPSAPAAWSNLGMLLASQQREDEAERCYRAALALDAGHARARFNLGYILLRQGRYAEGWFCLEARGTHDILRRHFVFPRWRGEALAGKSVLIGFEAGHGDMIQFCRYAAVLKAMGARRVAVVCHPGLKALFASLRGADDVFSCADDVPAAGWDFWTPPLSLPHYCQTRLDSVPAAIPYLAADPPRIARWTAQLPVGGLRVGLAWQGNPLFENDGERSLPALDVLAPLGAVAGLQLISLQQGPGASAALAPPAGLSLLPLGEGFADFADTAAVIAALDLVISVDTAVAHLAGALGKPCWLLLPDYRCDWRWLSGRSDSPWYPGSMRLFRQPPGAGWAPVVVAVRDALEQWKDERSAA